MKDRKTCCAVLAFCMMMSFCLPAAVHADTLNKYSATFYDAFDTITTLTGYAESEDIFNEAFSQVKETFLHYHRIFDAYHEYEGIVNLRTVNEQAGQGPVKAEPELIALLRYMKQIQPAFGNKVNIAMGAVLAVWHEYRETGTELPPAELLAQKAAHCDFDDVVIDDEAGTVLFLDPELRLDVGAVAKGYTTEIVGQMLLNGPMASFILNAGGNVRCGISPGDGRARWGVGIQDPGDDLYPGNMVKDILYVCGTSVVTSGDYQRFYVVDGVRYHHIIDPDTLYPADTVRSVTVVTEDSGFADALSTYLFILPYEESRAFADSLENTEAFWILADGSAAYTDGMRLLLQSQGASSRD